MAFDSFNVAALGTTGNRGHCAVGWPIMRLCGTAYSMHLLLAKAGLQLPGQASQNPYRKKIKKPASVRRSPHGHRERHACRLQSLTNAQALRQRL